MPIQKRNEFKVLSIEEQSGLSDYQRRKYYLRLEAQRKRKEVKDNFSKYLKDSCSRYE